MSSDENRLKPDRVALLSLAAVVNQIEEAWIAPFPFLPMLYFNQYMPTITKRREQREKPMQTEHFLKKKISFAGWPYSWAGSTWKKQRNFNWGTGSQYVNKYCSVLSFSPRLMFRNWEKNIAILHVRSSLVKKD